MIWLVIIVWGLLAVGWLALLLAPLHYRAAWVLARSCAMLVAVVTGWWWLNHAPLLIGMAAWPLENGLFAPAPAPASVMLAWLQLCSLTLFIGSWIVEDAPLHGIPHRVTAPLLAATALTGPVGWGCYMLVRDWCKWRALGS